MGEHVLVIDHLQVLSQNYASLSTTYCLRESCDLDAEMPCDRSLAPVGLRNCVAAAFFNKRRAASIIRYDDGHTMHKTAVIVFFLSFLAVF